MEISLPSLYDKYISKSLQQMTIVAEQVIVGSSKEFEIVCNKRAVPLGRVSRERESSCESIVPVAGRATLFSLLPLLGEVNWDLLLQGTNPAVGKTPFERA